MPDPLPPSGRRHPRSTRPRRAARLHAERLEARTAPAAQPVDLADPSLYGVTGQAGSSAPSVSADGQFVAFVSTADNLVPNDTDGRPDAFVYDRTTGTVSLASVGAGGMAAGIDTNTVAISPDGRYVAFVSGTGGDGVVVTGVAGQQVYVRDLQTGTTAVASAGPGGVPGNGTSYNFEFSADGHHLVFQSTATNIVPGVAYSNGYQADALYERDLTTGTTVLVTRSLDGTAGVDGATGPYGVSADGRYVVFQSSADNQVSISNNGNEQVYVRDTLAGTTALVSVGATGLEAGAGHNLLNDGPRAISADGRYVVFHSNAANLVPGVSGTQAYVRDLVAGTTTVVSQTAAGVLMGATDEVVSPDGRWVAFSTATGGVPADTNGHVDVYVRNLRTGALTLASPNAAGTNGGNADSGIGTFFDFPGGLSFSGDGRYLAFRSKATDLTPGVTTGNRNLYLRDLDAGVTLLATPNAAGTDGGAGDADTVTPAALSADGRVVAFDSTAPDLVAGDDNRATDVFVRDVAAGTTAAASVRSPLMPAAFQAEEGAVLGAPETAGAGADQNATQSSVSADGRYVAFDSLVAVTTTFSSLAPGVTFASPFTSSHVFVQDRQTGKLTVVDLDPTGTTALGGYDPVISPDGRYVVFLGYTNLLPAGVAYGNAQDINVYVRDLQTNTTTLVSVDPTGAHDAPIAGVFDGELAISADGRYVAWTSIPAGAVAGVQQPATYSWSSVYLRDLQAGTTYYVSHDLANDGMVNGRADDISLSTDGRFVVFRSTAPDLAANDTNGGADVFRWDRTTGAVELVSRNYTGNASGNQPAAANASRPVASADGRVVVYDSAATDVFQQPDPLHPPPPVLSIFKAVLPDDGGPPAITEVFGSAAGNSYYPAVSADGSTVAFISEAHPTTDAEHTIGRQNVYVAGPGGVRLLSQSIRPPGGTITVGPYTGNGDSGGGTAPVVSPDGRYVAFLSYATDLVSGFADGNGPSGSDLYIYDLHQGLIRAVSINQSGTAGGNASQDTGLVESDGSKVTFSGDSGTLVFDSAASDLVIGDRNRQSDVFAVPAAGFSTIAGQVFADNNANGTADGGEAGLPYWTVYADTNGNGRLDPGEPVALTDASGHYALTGLTPGTYTVRVVPQAGYVQTTPAVAATVSITTDGTTAGVTNFGEYLPHPDLAAAAVAFTPAAAAPGDAVTVTWTVTNHGTAAAAGSWQDAVYLSPTPTLGPTARLVATAQHLGGLAVGGSYTGTAAFPVPAALGTYYVIVITDSRAQVPEGPFHSNRADNVAASAAPLPVAVPALVLGQPAAGLLTAGSPDRYFQVTAPAGRSLTLTLSGPAAGAADVYVSRNGLPTDYAFDFAARGTARPGQTVTIPVAQGGVYYVLVHGTTAAAAVPFTLTASAPGFAIQSLGATSGGNGGKVTIPVHGTDLTPTTAVSLVLGSTVIPAAVTYQDASLLYATVDLTGAPAGTYTLTSTNGAQTATAPTGFTVAQARGPNLQVHLGTPSAIRLSLNPYGDLEIDYANTGDTDMPAPVFVLSVDQGGLEFLVGGRPVPPSLKTLQFVGVGSDSPAGVLRAGDSGVVKVRLTIPTIVVFAGGGGGSGSISFGGTGNGVTVSLSTLPTDATPIDWPSLSTTLQPPTVPADAWAPVYANFTAAVGSTTGQLQSALVADTAYLNQIGVSDPTFAELLAFEVLRADAALPVPTLGAATDVSYPAPGLSLDFSRRFDQSISGRYTLGTLGRGWVSDWDVAATTDATGNVTITDAGVPRLFTKQANGSYLASPGDYASLFLVNGAYRLVEQNGEVLAFRPDGRLDFVADANGNRITAGYNAAGQLVTLTQSDGAVLTITYNAQRLVSTVTDPAGRTATYTYDAGEHLLSVTTPQGTTSYTYVTGQGAAEENALASIAYPDGTHQYYTYDALGRLSGTSRDGGADAVAITYPSPGGATFTDAAGSTTIDYDRYGRPAVEVDPLGRTTRLTYDAAGNVVGLTLPGGLSYAYAYDARGDLTQATDPLGRVTGFTYGRYGNVTSLTDAKGNTTRYGYDAQGNLLAVTYADGSQKKFSYDPLGDLTDTINARGTAVGYAYNAAGEVTTVTYADGSTQTYTYDAHGNLATATDATGTTTLTYDAADRLTEVAYPDGTFLQFTYNAGGQRTRSVDQTGYAVDYAYDAAGRLLRLTDGSRALIAAYIYDAAGRLVEKDLGNGTYTTYDYDAAGELLHLVNHAPRPAPGQDGPVDSRFDYTYDGLGNVATETTLDGTWVYTYDADGELTHAVFTSTNPALPNEDETFTYDAAGNRTQTIINGVTTAYTTNALNEYTQVGDTSYTYDADGNLATATTAGVTTTYTFDDLNRLTGVTDPTGTTTHTYDALGNLASTTVNGATTRFLNDPTGFGSLTGLTTVFGEFSGASALAHYATGLGLVSRTDSSGTAYYDFDALGSVAGLTNAAGQVVNKYAYEPFGAVTTLAAGVANPYTFVGQFGVTADAGGLLRMGFRDYNPTTGQFASNDPLGLGGGDANVRRYVGNSSIVMTDPTGLSDQIGNDFGAGLGDAIAAVYGSAGALAGAIGNTLANTTTGVPNSTGSASVDLSVEGVQNLIKTNPDLAEPLQAALDRFNRIQGQARAFGYVRAGSNILAAAQIGFQIPRAFGLAQELGAHQNFIPIDPGFAANPIVRTIFLLNPADPNNLVGPAGYGPAGYIPPGQPLTYSVAFENDPTRATAAAEDVVVTTTLDPNLDWSTFAFGSIQFGSTTISIPAGLQSFATSVTVTNVDGTPLRVDVTAVLDRSTGVVTWTFHSVDPATGLTPTNPIAGFLPVDDATGRGEGLVTYTIQAKAGLPTGTPLTAQASVVFDVNAPLATNAALNTIDADPPTSAVQPLPATTTDPNIVVSWAGADGAGSGVAAYTVYVSVDGGAFTPWLTGTTLTSATYAGAVSHTYSFYSVATDNVGQTQPTPAAGQASTAVVAPSPPTTPPTVPPTTPPTVPPTTPPTVPPPSPPTTPPTVPPSVPPTIPPTVPPTPPPTVPPTTPPTVPPAVPPGVPPVVPPPPAGPSPVLVGYPQYAAGQDAGGGHVILSNPDGSVRFDATPFPGFTGGVRTAAADFNGDGVADLVVGTGPGGPSHVVILDGKDQHVLFALDPFEASFTGGVYVAAGDVTGDGVPDLIITPDEGGGPRVEVFDGKTFAKIADFYGIDDPAFRGGARAAVGDVNGDGVGDLIVAAGFQGGPRVAGFDGTSLATGTPRKIFGDFFAFEPTLRNGVYLTVGDVNGDGYADVIVGGGPGGGPRVTVYDGKSLLGNQQAPVADFFAGDPANRGGVRLAVKDLDGDGHADLVVGSGSGAGSHVTAYAGKTLTGNAPPSAFDYDAFPGFAGGVFVG